MKSILSIAGIAVAGAMVAGSASAAITGTYVGAENLSNTFLASDGVSSMANAFSGGDAWRDATTGSGANLTYEMTSGGFAYEPNDNDGEVVTTITGLSAGQDYSINVVFGNFIFNSYAFNAGFASGNHTFFPNGSGVDTGESANTSILDVYEVTIGTTTADGNGEIDVFIQDDGSSARFVYYGVSYTAVPEPGSLALLGLGGLGLLRRRR